MMYTSVILAVMAATATAVPFAVDTAAACKSNKAIDNFANWANKTNSLGAVTGDDKSMSALAVTGTTLALTAKAGSYFYENLPCDGLDDVDLAPASGYTGISFVLGGPAQSSLLLEVQTKAACNASTHASYYHNVTVPAASSAVVVPLSVFAGANLSSVSSLTFSTFNKTGVYSLTSLEFVCQGK